MGYLSHTHAARIEHQYLGDYHESEGQAKTTVVMHLPDPSECAVHVQNLSVSYGQKPAVRGVTLSIARNRVTALIGPSGCGKSTLLRALNRLNDRIPGVRVEGSVRIEGIDPYAPGTDLIALRRYVGMVFQKPTPLPMSIYDNVAIGARTHYGLRGKKLDEVVEQALHRAALWDEVKDILRRPAHQLSGGQQQRLCIARMLAVGPRILLLDEPCSALDPVSTFRIEELMTELAEDHTVIVVTHNMQQAARVSHYTAFFMFGELIEYNLSGELFVNPQQKATEDYIRGRFG